MMAGQLAAAHSSLLLPPSFSPSLRKKYLIPERLAIPRKKNHAIKVLAGISLGKSATRLTAVSSPLFTDNHYCPSFGAPMSRRGKSATGLTAVSSPLFTDNHDCPSFGAPMSRRGNSNICPQAYIYHWSGFRIPANAEKPEWWWRTLSCIPYLIALQMSATGFYLEPLLAKFQLFENVIFYIPGAVSQLPTWFPMLYYYLASVVVVKNRDLPLLFRFHVMMGMLLEIALQIVWVASNFMPLIHFKGTLGMYYWAGVALAYILITMQCIRSALLGTFVKIPVLSESAFLHSIFSLGGFQRPF